MKTFLDKDFKVDKALFEKLKVRTLTSWEELEIRATMAGIDLDKRIFGFMLVGASFYENIHKMVLHAFETPCIDRFFDTYELLELIYKIYSPLAETRTYSGKEAWLDFADAAGDTNALQRYYLSGLRIDNMRRYELLTLIDAKFPLVVVEFYNAHRKELQAIDGKFEVWLLMVWSQRKSPEGKQIYDALAKLHDDDTNVKKFLN